MRERGFILTGLIVLALSGCEPTVARTPFQAAADSAGTSRYVVIEAEDAVDYTFTPGYYPLKAFEIEKAELLSGGRCLLLKSDDDPWNRKGYSATYEVVIQESGAYDLVGRLATLSTGQDFVLRVRFDEGDWSVVKGAEHVLLREPVRHEFKGTQIEGHVVLARLHSAQLEKGKHSITVEVMPAAGSSVFLVADAFALGESPFAVESLGRPDLAIENSSLLADLPVDIVVYPGNVVNARMSPLHRGVALYSLGNPAASTSTTADMKRLGVDFTRFFLYHSSIYPLPDLENSPYRDRLERFLKERGYASLSDVLERAASRPSIRPEARERFKQIAGFLAQQHVTFDNPGAARWDSTDNLYKALNAYDGLAVLAHSDRVPVWLSSNAADLRRVRAGANMVLAALSYAPNNFTAYRNIWQQSAKHLAGRFPKLVRYLEIHNEPDLEEFLRLQTTAAVGSREYEKGQMDVYLKMYEAAVQGIAESGADVKVGGPAVAGGEPKYDWIESLVQHCAQKKLRLDFISWHMYGKQPLEVRNAILKVREILERHGLQNAELIIDEWNVDGAGGMNAHQRRLFNSNFNAALSAATLAAMVRAGLDRAVFFYDRDQTSNVSFGLLTESGQKKPVYFAFQLFSMLGSQEIKTVQTSYYKVGSLATLTEDGEIALLVWNYDPSEKVSRNVRVKVQGAPGLSRFKIYAVDASHSVLGDREVAMTRSGSGACEFRLAPNSVKLVQLSVD